MTQKEKFDQIAAFKNQMRSILDIAETEKRSLTADEQASFDVIEGKNDMLKRSLKCDVDTAIDAAKPVDFRAAFAKNLTMAVESGSRTTISIRAAGDPITSVDVADTIPMLYQDVLDALTPALVMDQLGLKMQSNVQGEPVWPTVAGVEATIESENVEVSDKTLLFGKLKASPKRVSISIPVSRRSFNQSNLDLYGIVTKQIGLAVAKLLNRWLLSPVAVGGTTGGVFTKAAPDVDFAVSGAPTNKEIVELETIVASADVDMSVFGAYVCSPSMAGALKSTAVEAGNPKMILEGNEMNGYPVIRTNLIPAGYVGFGFFSYAVLSEFGISQIIVDPYTGAKQNKVNFVLNGDFDLTVLRPEAFSLGFAIV